MTDVDMNVLDGAEGGSAAVVEFLLSKKDDHEFPGIVRRVVEEVYARALADAYAVVKDLVAS